jgi:hypothetical protein
VVVVVPEQIWVESSALVAWVAAALAVILA